jgi:beta-lactamase superfamily II metal-dependent hydrolase
VPFHEDTAVANGSSIVVLLEHAGKAAVLCGDAFPRVVQRSVQRLLEQRGEERLAVDAFKLPHHGSHSNISLELLETLSCPQYLFSSNGSHTHHPHPEAVARVLVADSDERSLQFNYRTRYNEIWGDDSLRDQRHYEATFPSDGALGLRVSL